MKKNPYIGGTNYKNGKTDEFPEKSGLTNSRPP
jgi:hypothetical protein